MRREELLYEAITLIDDDLIDGAAELPSPRRRPVHWRRWALCACLVLVVGAAGIWWVTGGGFGGASSGQGGGGEGNIFLSYAGPVFPLTALGDTGGVTAERDMTLDFQPWVPTWVSNEEQMAERTDLTPEEWAKVADDLEELYPEGGHLERSDHILVSDSYTLTNAGAEDRTLTVLYPFASALWSLDETTPSLTVDGQSAESALRIGRYTGGFTGAVGGGGESLNLEPAHSWEDYRDVLSDGTYLEQARSELPDFAGVEATVYTFTNAWGPGESEDAPNPSIRVTFDLDYDQTTVLTTGFHAGMYDREKGKMGKGFSIPQPGEREQNTAYRLIVIGEEIANMEVRGYVTGGWDTEKELEDFGVDVERTVTSLDEILRQAVREGLEDGVWGGNRFSLDFETFYGLFCDYLLSYGPLAPGGGVQRYDSGMLEDLDVASAARVCYLETEVTVPAGGSVTVTAELDKEPSFDYTGVTQERQGVNSYDLVTGLGSPLTFTAQRCTLLDRGQIEIVDQNFGFDLEAGVTTVALDLDTEHYYLDVRRAAE